MSDIRVYVTFPESATVFAGENLECKIMFRNVSAIPGSRAVTSGGLVGGGGGGGGGGSQLTPPVTSNGFAPGDNGNAMGERRNKVLPLKSSAADRARSSVMSPRIPSARSSSAHKQPLSVNVPGGKLPASPVPPKATNGGAVHKHKRSISIVSLSSDIGAESGNRGGGAGEEVGARTPQLPHGRNHSRSASLQLMPRQAPGLPNGFAPKSASFPPHQLPTRKSSRPPTPIIIESETLNSFSFPARRSSPPATPVTPGSAKHSHSKPNSLNKFRFPPEPSGSPLLNNFTSKPDSSTDEGNDNIPRLSRKVSHIDLKSPIDDLDLPEFDHITQSRVISAHSVNGETPRSSGEFYSLSNSTTETLVSEYDPRAAVRLVKTTHNRRHSLLAIGPRSPEALMMGYAQVSGTFTLDGSLIQTSIFEEVKRKGVLGGQMGGGVVGLETSKSDGGFLSGFGWGNIGGSLGGLLGGNNMSSIANMKTLANTKSIPILSTPQSILFVDLRLAPGESRSYTYKFALPRGLPPSHRGKAIKITYNLVIGTQRPGKGVQQPKIVEIPFRVFPHVDLNGSMRVHDLMSPIVLLRDEATTTCVEDQVFIPSDQSAPKKPPKQESSLEDFMAYVDTLISPQVNGSTSTLNLLSPSLPNLSKRNSFYEEQPTTSKEAIEMAILRGPGNSSRASENNCSMFEIARNGRRVASLTLARPAYKLGETITAVIDFTNSQIPCYNINASLESSETVAPSIALRSASSILRATRKIHSQHSESTLFAKRVLFTPTIPTSATPEFSTSGVSCSWILRLEFITPALSARLGMDDPVIEDLLEQTNVDDRGELFEAKQGIYVESFDACIPVKVYPNAADAGVIGGGSVGVQTAAAATVGYVV